MPLIVWKEINIFDVPLFRRNGWKTTIYLWGDHPLMVFMALILWGWTWSNIQSALPLHNFAVYRNYACKWRFHSTLSNSSDSSTICILDCIYCRAHNSNSRFDPILQLNHFQVKHFVRLILIYINCNKLWWIHLKWTRNGRMNGKGAEHANKIC